MRGLSGPLYYTFFIATFLGIYESLLASHVLPADLPCEPNPALDVSNLRSL